MEKDRDIDLVGVARIVGPLMAVVGGILVFSFFWMSFNSIGSFQRSPSFGPFLIGAPLLIAGGPITRWAYLGPVSRYVAAETAPAVASVARTIASEARRTGIRCAGCHVENGRMRSSARPAQRRSRASALIAPAAAREMPVFATTAENP